MQWMWLIRYMYSIVLKSRVATLEISPHGKGLTAFISYVCTGGIFNVHKWPTMLIVKAVCFSVSVDTALELLPYRT